MIDVFLLEQLDAFAQCGTLSKAAQRLHVTQPALSRNMKKLEALLGVSLFERKNGRISLNATGEVAAECARYALEANRRVVDVTLAFERSQRTISLGSSNALITNDLMPLLQAQYAGYAITTELAENDALLAGLHNRSYQLALFCGRPEAGDLCCMRFAEENLYVSVPADHPLAQRKALLFADLSSTSIIASGNGLSWIRLCERRMPSGNLVVQPNVGALAELVTSSSMPFFSTDLALERGYAIAGRVAVPVVDDGSHAVYYLACLQSECQRYAKVFDAVGAKGSQAIL